jgi:hypothetical protein
MQVLSPEFRLAAACCRWPASPGRQALIKAAAAKVDWSLFTVVARQHRIEGLVWAALRDSGIELPDTEGRHLRAKAKDIARTNLFIAAECGRVAAAFQGHGLPLLFVKGLTLAKLAYGDISLKRGWDIDLLVAPDILGEAAQLLTALGYEATLPEGASAETLQVWHGHSKESVWRHDTKGHFVELHTSLVNSAYLLPGVGMQSAAIDVEVANGVVLPTLPRGQLFAYLCVHGASSAWFRLKWLADFAALAGNDAEEIERLYHCTQKLGAGRAAAQALLLATDLVGTPLPASLERTLRASRTNRSLAAASKRLMEGLSDGKELHQRRFGTWAVHWTQFLLLPDFRYVWDELRRQWGAFRHHNRRGA